MTARTHLVARRALTQPGLLAALVAVVLAGATLLGTCVLLLTGAQDRALAAALRAAPPAQVEVVASIEVAPPEAAAAGALVADAGAVLEASLAPAPTTLAAWASSSWLSLAEPGGGRALTYLLGADDVGARATLDAGTWPGPVAAGAPLEAALPVAVADLLGLELGDVVPLAALSGPAATAAEPSAGADAVGPTGPRVVVVGTFRAGTDADAARAWQRDPLEGAGTHPAWDVPRSRGRVVLPAYGPFVVDPAALLTGGAAAVERVTVVATPDLAAVAPGGLDAVVAGSDEARRELSVGLGARATQVRLATDLQRAVAGAHAQQRVTAAGVLVAAVVGAALAATALSLAAALVTARRADETALLVARGASRARLVRGALAEGAAVAVVAGALAVPASVAVVVLLGRVPGLGTAGLGSPLVVTAPLVATTAAAAVGLTVLLVAPVARGAGRAGRAARAGRSRVGRLARSGLDVALAVVAAVAVLRLRTMGLRAGAGTDPVLVAAPVLAVLAGSALALRAAPVLLAWGERGAGRARGLVGPLAVWDAARRPRSTGAAFLLVLATASATFGVASWSTWSGSQQDQADARTGADVVVETGAGALLTQGARLEAATGSSSLVPVGATRVALGTWTSEDWGSAVRLVAVDSAEDDAVRGRLPEGTTWRGLLEGLAPRAATPLRVPLDQGPAVTLTGTGEGGGAPLTAAVTLVLEDRWGARAPVSAAPVPLDGTPHALELPAGELPAEGPLDLVAVRTTFSLAPGVEVRTDSAASARVDLTLDLGADTATDGAPPGDWSALDPSHTGALGVPRADAGPDSVALSVSVVLGRLAGEPIAVLAVAFAPTPDLAVVVSEDLAVAADLTAGDGLTLQTPAGPLPARVERVAPYVPGVPAGPALLADADALWRASALVGALDPVTTGWWVSTADQAAAADGIAAAGLGDVVTRDAETVRLRSGPLRVGTPAALAVLVAAALVLALAGTGVTVAASLRARELEVARLHGLGVPRRAVAGSLVLQHAAVTAVSVALGVGVGAVSAWAVAPSLAVTEAGTAPSPAPVVAWPWPAQAGVVGALLVSCTLVVVPVATGLVRRASAAHLRLDGGAS